MAKGLCFRPDCRGVMDMDSTFDVHDCEHCGCHNIYRAAASRFNNDVAKTVPSTPDPIMNAVNSQPSTDPAQAFKSDAGKVQFDLLEDGAPNALLEIAKVMSWAVEVKGYHPHSWQEIPDAIRRYKAALGRHRNAIARGEVLDPESGLLHWAHAACCVIFITELELRLTA